MEEFRISMAHYHQLHHFPFYASIRRPSSQIPSRSWYNIPAWTRSYSLRPARGNAPIPQIKEQAQMKVDLNPTDVRQLPRDLGLFDGTFIMPTGQNKPSFFSSPKARLKLRWLKWRHRVTDLIALVTYKWITKPRLKLRFREVAPAALALHKQMYTAFAAGDVHTLRKICGEGVMASFLSRIQARNPRERYEWKLHKYTKFTRVVSDRAVRLPMELSGQRQAVVRIQSRQNLTKYRPDGSVVPGTGQEKELREYVVIQKRLLNGKEEPWFVWGTTEETTLEEVERRERRKRGEE